MTLEGQVLGDFRILHEIGRGGMGVVYLAEQISLSRRVALKVLPSSRALAPEVLARFRREAEAASRLNHPLICAVYATGAHDGIPFIAMRYVEGMPLSQRMRERRRELTGDGGPVTNETFRFDFDGPSGVTMDGGPPAAAPAEDGFAEEDDEDLSSTTSITATRDDIRWAVKLVEQAARALHYAHEARVIHRDIKPSNIMVTPEDEPVLLDFGLARSLEGGEGPSLTQSGDLMGTPHYMSPEQLSGGGRVDARTDVYSLGVTLYELISGRRPFEAPNRERLYRSILTDDATPIHHLNPLVERDLEIVLSTAIDKDLNRRYQTAAAFADDLRAVLDHEPIAARPVGLVLRGRKWFRRNPVIATVGIATLVLLAIVAGILWFDSRRLEDERNRAFKAKADADLARQEADRAATRAREAARRAEGLVAEKEAALRQSDALRLAAEATARAVSEPALALALALQASRIEPTVETDRALRIALAAAAEEVLLPAPRLPSLVTDPRENRRRGRRGDTRLFGPGRRRVRDGGPDDTVVERLRSQVPPTGDIHWGKGLAITLAAERGGVPVVWDIATGRMVSVLAAHAGQVFTARFNRDGTRVVTVGDDRACFVFDARSGRPLQPVSPIVPPTMRFGGREREFQTAWFSPRSRRVLTIVGVTDGGIYTWRQMAPGKGRFERNRRVFQDAYRAVRSPPIAASHPRWPLIANAATERVFVWDTVGTGNEPERQIIKGVSGTVSAVAWSPTLSPEGGARLAVGYSSGRVSVWEIPRRAGRPFKRVWQTDAHEHTAAVTCLEFSHDGEWLASGSADHLVGMWSVSTRTQRWRAFRHDRAVRDLTWSPNDQLLATGAADHRARILDATTGSVRQVFAGHPDWVVRVEFDDTGRRLYTQSYDGSARIHGVSRQDGDELSFDLPGQISSVEWSPVSTQELCVTSRDGKVRIVDVSEPDPVPRVILEDEDVIGARFLRDGTRVIALSKGAAWLRGIRTGTGTVDWTLVDRPSDPVAGRVRSFLSPSSDGRHAVVAGPGGTPKLVRTSDGRVLVERLGGQRLSNALYLVTAARPGRREFLLWSPSGALLYRAGGRRRACDTASLTGHPVAAAFSGDGRYLALTDSQRRVALFDLADESQQVLIPLEAAQKMTAPPAWLPRVSSIAVAPSGGFVQIVNIGGDGVTQTLGLPSDGIELLRATSSGAELVAIKRGEIVIWDLERNRARAQIPFGSAAVADWDISDQGLLALGLASGTVRIVPIDAVVEALGRNVRAPVAAEMARFKIGTDSERAARAEYEAKVIRSIELEALHGRAAYGANDVHNLAYARRIMDSDDLVRERFDLALKAAEKARDIARTPGPEHYQVLAFALHYNERHDEAVAAIKQAIDLANGDAAILERDLRFLEAAAGKAKSSQ